MLYSRLLALVLGANRRMILQGAVCWPAVSLRIFFQRLSLVRSYHRACVSVRCCDGLVVITYDFLHPPATAGVDTSNGGSFEPGFDASTCLNSLFVIVIVTLSLTSQGMSNIELILHSNDSNVDVRPNTRPCRARPMAQSINDGLSSPPSHHALGPDADTLPKQHKSS